MDKLAFLLRQFPKTHKKLLKVKEYLEIARNVVQSATPQNIMETDSMSRMLLSEATSIWLR